MYDFALTPISTDILCMSLSNFSQSTTHSKLPPHKVVSCFPGTDFSTCCESKNPTAEKCKGSIVAKPTQSPLLGSTGGPAPAKACTTVYSTPCNTTFGSNCVYISGGAIRTPMCSCSTDAAVCNPPSGPPLTPFICGPYKGAGSNLPNNYKGNVCYQY